MGFLSLGSEGCALESRVVTRSLSLAATAVLASVPFAWAQGLSEVSPHGEVNPSGSYVQRVPLDVPGYHGLEPTVALVYDSSNRDGDLGWGWRLSLVSSIARVSRRTGLAHLDFTDEFLLDGELLIPCQDQSTLGSSCSLDGTHGLEHETFQRVRLEANGDWQVWDRNGVVSRYRASGSDSLKSVRWDLTSRADPKGNELEYHYWCDGKDECYLADVEYHDGPIALRTHITAHWEKRPAEAGYAVGAADLVHIRYRLKNLVVTTNGKTRNALDIVYLSGKFGRWSDASLVHEIVRYGSDVELDGDGRIVGGTHLPPETFGNYDAAPPAAKAVQVSLLPAVASTGSNWTPSNFITAVPAMGVPQGGQAWNAIDLDGDGLDDAVAVVPDGSSYPSGAKLLIQLNRGDGTFSAPEYPISTSWLYWIPQPDPLFAGPIPPDRGQAFLAGDFNGDGLKDLLAIWPDADGHVKAQIAFGSTNVFHVTLGAIQDLPVPGWRYRHKWLVGDFDGDGRSDLAIVEAVFATDGCNPEEAGCTIPRVHLLRSDGASFIAASVTDAPWSNFGPDSPYWFVGDVNGDGQADIIRVMRTGSDTALASIGVGLSNGAGFSFSSFPTTTSWTPTFIFDRPNPNFKPVVNDMAQIGDFDGNGLTDVLILTGRPANESVKYDHIVVHTFLSQGWGPNTFEGGDGHETETSLDVMLTNAYSGAGVSYKGTHSFPNRWLTMDIDRDGVTDLVLVTAPNITGFPWPQPLTQVITMVSNRDGSFQSPVGRDINMPFDCWDVSPHDECAGGPRFQVMPAELNGDQELDLLFAHFGRSSGFVELGLVPAADAQDAATNWRLADISGDGRLDAIKIQGLGDSVRIQSFILPQMGIGPPFLLRAGETPPSPVLQVVSTAGVPLAGIDIGHWSVADIDSPQGTGPDGRADLIYQSVTSSGTGAPNQRLLALVSNGDGTFLARIQPGPALSGGKNNLWRLGDFDGDGRTTPGRVTLASPGQLTVELQGRQPKSIAVSGIIGTTGFVVADLDGDGLADFVTVQSTPLPDGSTTSNVVALLGMGNGNFRFVQWPPLPAEALGIPARAWRPADLNGDGKSDLVAAIPGPSGYERVVGLLFTGSAWVFQEESFTQTIATSARVVNVADFNGDGCTDLAWKDSVSALVSRYTWLINHCDGSFETSTAKLTTTPGATYPVDSAGNGIDRYASSWQSADLAGTGRANLITIRDAGAANAVLITPYDSQVGPGLLNGVDNGIGFSSGITYDSSAGSLAPTRFAQPSPVVSSIHFAAMSASSGFESTYTYTGGRWSSVRKFLGFASISVLSRQSGSSIANHRVQTDYEQTEACAMRPKRIAVLSGSDPARTFYSDSFTYYDTSLTLTDFRAPFATAPWICELQRSSHSDCELRASCRERSVQVRYYDSFGNITQLVGLGDPQEPSDDRTTTTRFLPPNSANYLVSLPYDVELKDATGSRVSDTQTFYDGNMSHNYPAPAGNPTRTDQWVPVNGTLTTLRFFDAFGNVTQITDADGRVANTVWDPTFARFPIRDCNPDWCVSHDWDLVLGQKTLETDANGQQVSTTYDPLRRQRRTDYPDGGCLTHDYMQWGAQSNPFDFSRQRIVETRCSRGSNGRFRGGASHTIYFDGLQRTWKEERSGKYQMFRTFDGWKSKPQTESLWQNPGSTRITIHYYYDDAQRLTRVALPDGQQYLTTYDTDTVTKTSPTGGVHRTTWDGWSRVHSVSDDVVYSGKRVPATAVFAYDSLDHLQSATDANGHMTQWSWSPLGWSRSVCRPDTGCRIRTFLNTGLVRSEQDALGQHIEYDYDDLARLTERRQYDSHGTLLETSQWEYGRARPSPISSVSGAHVIVTPPVLGPPSHLPPLEPNLVGRLRRVSSSAGTSTDFSYDTMGRVSGQRDCVAGDCVSVSFGWNHLGRIASVRYPDDTGAASASSQTVTYSYDAAARVHSVSPYIARIDYDPDDKIRGIHFNQGVVQSMVYDDNRRWMKSMEVDGPQGGGTVGLSGQIASWTYEYFPDGRLKNELRRGLVNSQRFFTYDPAGRVLGVNYTDGYDYDLAGNILHHNGDAYLYADSDHPNAVTQAGSSSLTYDADGQIIMRNGSTLTWDPLGRLLQEGTGAAAVRYLYSSNGALARRQSGSDTAVYFNSYVERQTDGELALNYLLDGTIFARQERPFGTWYFHHDRLGSVTEITADNGVAGELYSYGLWGTSTPALGRTNEFRFAGGRQDAGTGLLRLAVRSLDPALGRFISPDPLIAQPHGQWDLNPYVYAHDDPLNSTDPSGMQPAGDDANATRLSADWAPIDWAGQTIDYVKENLTNPKFIVSPLSPVVGRSDVAKDPLDALFLVMRGMVESTFPEVQILALPGFRSLAKGESASVSGGGCFGFCFLNFELGVGIYLTPPKGPNDKYFNDIHLDFTVGGAFLGVTPQSNINWLNPDAHITEQLALGLGGGVGASFSGYLTQATTREDHKGFSRQLSVAAGPASISVSRNRDGQFTVSNGTGWPPPSATDEVGAMGAVYNTFTLTSPGIVGKLRGAITGPP
jgi:RHS repeat-associated protein